jgi:aminoglycoside phosphotransferase (APT) family kinase protein
VTPASHLPPLTPVRDKHRFDEAALAAYLEKHVPDCRGPLEIQQFEGGQSNPTFLIRSGGRGYVMRKKPPGKLLKSAHQVDREYRVMSALRSSGVPVPETYSLCRDASVIGSEFFVMEYVEGRVIGNSTLPGFEPAERTALHYHAMEVLAAIHRVDPEEVGLSDFGRPGNYYARQIARWSKQYEASKTEEIESMDALAEWLPANIPASDDSGLVHGDYRIGNCIIHPTEPRIVAVLDWEISTLGHPLADLAYYMLCYHGASSVGDDLRSVDLAAMGIPSEEEMLARYSELAGRPVEDWRFYIIFQTYRAASIVQGVYKRGLDGNASSSFATSFGDLVRQRADLAWQMVQG